MDWFSYVLKCSVKYKVPSLLTTLLKFIWLHLEKNNFFFPFFPFCVLSAYDIFLKRTTITNNFKTELFKKKRKKIIRMSLKKLSVFVHGCLSKYILWIAIHFSPYLTMALVDLTDTVYYCIFLICWIILYKKNRNYCSV